MAAIVTHCRFNGLQCKGWRCMTMATALTPCARRLPHLCMLHLCITETAGGCGAAPARPQSGHVRMTVTAATVTAVAAAAGAAEALYDAGVCAHAMHDLVVSTWYASVPNVRLGSSNGVLRRKSRMSAASYARLFAMGPLARCVHTSEQGSSNTIIACSWSHHPFLLCHHTDLTPGLAERAYTVAPHTRSQS
jgi:hypothetical protein